mmetsp:Transcript_134915/g.269205  ORF Transcript_134915/g.269205 Transcript_134915/m.269205 type:complete len:789 (+) Transcript_134915:74-2440(+)
MRVADVWLIARLGPRVDELARCLRAAFTLAPACSVILLEGSEGCLCRLLRVVSSDLDGAISEADVLALVFCLAEASAAALTLDVAATALASNGCVVDPAVACPIVFLDEGADDDWSWTAPDLARSTVCFGVHEDFVHELDVIRHAAVNSGACCQAARLGPVALHSSACLHLLSSVRPGAARVPTATVRPATVQTSCAQWSASARRFRRALPRRQPIRFILALQEHPSASAASRAEVHQAIVAACLVSKSVYDERDTRLMFVWPRAGGMRAVTVDRSLLGVTEGRFVPAELPVLEALSLEITARELAFEVALEQLLDECSRLAFASPVALRIVEGGPTEWPEGKNQAVWPTDPPLLLFLRWQGSLPLPEHATLVAPGGRVAARTLVVLQHWHTMGVLAAAVSPRGALPCRGVKGLLEDVVDLVPTPGQDVISGNLVSVQGTVVGRVRQGHVLFADFGPARAMCKEQRLGHEFRVLVAELRVGDVLHCEGLPGLDFHGAPTVFVQHIRGIEPGTQIEDTEMEEAQKENEADSQQQQRQQQQFDCQHRVLYRDGDVLVLMKPAGMLAKEDGRHRHERGTALRAPAQYLLAAPEVEVSGPAVFAWRPVGAAVLCHVRRRYWLLVAGRPQVSVCKAALRPGRGQPHNNAETLLQVLWEGPDSSLVQATTEGNEQPQQIRRHMHILGCPVWGDRRFGNQRANLRSRAIYGLTRPWCHLVRLELSSEQSIVCESPPPGDLLRVLRAVGCHMKMPGVTSCRMDQGSAAVSNRLVKSPAHEQQLAIRSYLLYAKQTS